MELLTRLEPLRGSLHGETLSRGRLPLVANPGLLDAPPSGETKHYVRSALQSEGCVAAFTFFIDLVV